MQAATQEKARNGFLAGTGPPELIVRIFQSCDSTRDLLALVSASRNTYCVWQAYAAPALWRVWRREIPYVQNALVAARMTHLVVDAERRGELPPKGISPAHLEGPEQPMLAELKAAFNLHRLSHALAEAFCQRDVVYPSGKYHLPGGMSNDTPLDTYNIDVDMSGKKHRMPPEPPDRVIQWMARVSQAVFRVLTVGAALAGTYWEPILVANAHPDPEVRLLTTEGAELEAKAWDFLLSFAAYDLEAPLEAQDALFAPLVEWFLADILGDQQGRKAMAARFEKGVGRAKLCLDRGEDENWPCPLATVIGIDGSSHADAHLVVWELMKMVWMVEQLRPWNSPEPAA
ncbi:hypothetical protein C8A05DRAFT_39759, partial [Staphylotrichum tortipilum]